jgi:hypothetical protein
MDDSPKSLGRVNTYYFILVQRVCLLGSVYIDPLSFLHLFGPSNFRCLHISFKSLMSLHFSPCISIDERDSHKKNKRMSREKNFEWLYIYIYKVNLGVNIEKIRSST